MPSEFANAMRLPTILLSPGILLGTMPAIKGMRCSLWSFLPQKASVHPWIPGGSTAGRAPHSSAHHLPDRGDTHSTLCLLQVKGRTIYNSDMVNIPNWCLIQLKIGSSDWVSPFDKDCRILSYSHSLNFRDGCLQRTIVFRDPQVCPLCA